MSRLVEQGASQSQLGKISRACSGSRQIEQLAIWSMLQTCSRACSESRRVELSRSRRCTADRSRAYLKSRRVEQVLPMSVKLREFQGLLRKQAGRTKAEMMG